MANIDFSLCVITKSLVISESQSHADMNFDRSDYYMRECLTQFREIYGGEDNEYYQRVYNYLAEERQDEDYHR